MSYTLTGSSGDIDLNCAETGRGNRRRLHQLVPMTIPLTASLDDMSAVGEAAAAECEWGICLTILIGAEHDAVARRGGRWLAEDSSLWVVSQFESFVP